MGISTAKKVAIGAAGVALAALATFGIVTLATSNSEPSQELIEVPAVKQVLADRLDNEMVDVDLSSLSLDNIQDSGYRIRTKATFVAGAFTPPNYTLDELYSLEGVDLMDKLLTVQEYLSTVYDIGDENYYVSFLSVPDENDMSCGNAIDAQFYRDNDAAQKVDDVICDPEKGVAYIPKSYYENYEATDIDRLELQTQLLFRYFYPNGDSTAKMDVPVEISTDKGQRSTFYATVDSFAAGTTIKVVEDGYGDKVKPENVKVTLNDEAYKAVQAISSEPDEDIVNTEPNITGEETLGDLTDNYSGASQKNMIPIYNAEDGTVTVPVSASNLMNIRVKIETEEPVELCSTQVSLYAASPYDLEGFNTGLQSSFDNYFAALGGQWAMMNRPEAFPGYWYNMAQGNSSDYGVVFGTGGCYLDSSGSVYSTLSPNGGAGWTRFLYGGVTAYRMQIGAAGSTWAVNGAGSLVKPGGSWKEHGGRNIESIESDGTSHGSLTLPNGWKTGCWDSAHASEQLGDYGYTGGSYGSGSWIFGWERGAGHTAGTRGVWFKVLAQNKTDHTLTLAFVSPNMPGCGGQACGMVVSFNYQSSTKVTLTKSMSRQGYMSTNSEYYHVDGAEYGIYTDRACTTLAHGAENQQECRGTTDNNGKIEFPAIESRSEPYFLKEIKAPKGCYLDTRVYELYATSDTLSSPHADESNFVRLSLKKTSTDPTSISNPYYNFNGITYRIEGIDNSFSKDVTLRDNGKTSPYAITSNIEVPFGKYRVYEIATNDWYHMDATPKEIDLTEDHLIATKVLPNPKGYNTNVVVPTQQLEFADRPIGVKIDLIKNTSNASITDDCDTYSRNGAKYILENARADGANATGHGYIFETHNFNGQDGYAISPEVLYDDWKIHEIEASESFALDTNIYSISEDNLEKECPHPPSEHANTPKTFHLNTQLHDDKFAPENPQWTLYDLQKLDLYSSTNLPEEKATFEDAVFEIKYYDNYEWTGAAHRTWYISTDKNGYATIQNIVAGDMTKSTKQDRRIVTKTFTSDEPYRDPEGTGQVVMPTGSFTVQEVLNPEGYLFDNGTIVGPGKVYKYVVRGNTKSSEQDMKCTPTENIPEEVYRADLQLVKIDEDDQSRMSGIPFVIEAKDSGEWHAFVTDENGVFTSQSSYAEHNMHAPNLNKNDECVVKNAEGSFAVTNYGGLSPDNGIFFKGYGPKNDPDGSHAAAMSFDDLVQALPYGDYTIYELACDKNREHSLRVLEWSIYRDAQSLKDGISNAGTIEDNSQWIGTTAVDQGTGGHQGDAAAETVTIVDTVAYHGLTVDNGKGQPEKYRFVGTLMDKATSEPLVDENGNKFVTVLDPFIPEEPDGFVNLEFVVPGQLLAGKTVVAFEEVYDTKRQVTTHADINDEGQTVDFPGIKTTATDDTTGGHEGSVTSEIVKIHDEVQYTGLQTNIRYTLYGTLMDKETGEPILEDGKPVTASLAFQPTTNDGSVTLTFEVRADVIEGKTTVVFEDLYRQDKLVTTHHNLRDEAQTVHYPKISTTATDGVTDTHMGLADEPSVIHDRVDYWNLVKDETYTMSGVLMDKATGKPLVGADGKEVRVSREFVAGMDYDTLDIKQKAEDYTNTFNALIEELNAYNEKNEKPWKPSDETLAQVKAIQDELNGDDKSIWESEHESVPEGNYDKSVYHNEEADGYDGKVVLINIGDDETPKWTNINSFPVYEQHGDQSLSYHAEWGEKDDGTYGIRFAQASGILITPGKDVIMVDIPDPTWEVKAFHEVSLQDEFVETEVMYEPSELLPYLVTTMENSEEAKPFTMIATAEFYESLDADTQEKVGEMPSTGEVENIIDGLIEIAEEEARIQELQKNAVVGFPGTDDYDGKCIEVRIPDGDWTFASQYLDGNKDSGEYTNVAYQNNKFVWAKHTMNGTTPMVEYEDINGHDLRIVKLEDYGRWEQYSEDGRIDWHVTLEFEVPRDVVMGHAVVVFENLYYDVDGDGKSEHIAKHEDINDEGQTVRYPNVGTTATVNGIHDAGVGPNTVIIDTVEYKGLQVGQEYVIDGVLMDKETSKPAIDANGAEIHGHTTFVTDKEDGTAEVQFVFDSTFLLPTPDLMKTHEVVVFEKLYTAKSEVADELILVGQHEDINDAAQTIKFNNTNLNDELIPLALPETGDTILFVLLGAILVAGVVAGVNGGFRRKRR